MFLRSCKEEQAPSDFEAGRMEARSEWCLEGMERLLDCNTIHIGAGPPMSVTKVLHTMQDHLKQTTFFSQRRAQKMLYEHSPKRWVTLPARPWRQLLKCVSGNQRHSDYVNKKRHEAAEAETVHNGAMKGHP